MFVIMNLKTEALYRKPGHYTNTQYPTLRGARGAASRLNKEAGSKLYNAISGSEFHRLFNPVVTVKNLMSGQEVQLRKEDVGGPCDPSTERYWSM